jgi:peptidyl-dipeptidase A
MRDGEARRFVERVGERLEPADIALGQAEWQLTTEGDEGARARMAEARAEWIRTFADPEQFARLRAFRAEGADDAALDRQLDVLYSMFLEHHFLPEEVERIAALEADTSYLFNTYRGEVGDRRLSDNDIEEILSASSDSDERRAAWEASKGVGPIVRDNVVALVRLRNEAARRAGFRDYYAMQLEAQETDERWLFGTLERLSDLTERPFARRKAEIDALVAARVGCRPDEIRPWHYADPFFQKRPDVGEVQLDPLFESADIEALTLATYDGLGLEIRDIVERSDLYEREGKDQHAFCRNIGRAGDIRVLCNLRPTARWMETNLHEFGHAVYDKYIDYGLPYLLRDVAHINCTEAIAMLMGRQASSPEWLAAIRGMDGAEAARVGEALREQLSTQMLILVRWCLVMAHFERDLYADPDRTDLNSLWWDYVERFQHLSRPDGRDEPDWAAKVHLAIAPVYYHNYMLGEMIASQIQERIEAEAGGLVNSHEAGAFLRDRLFTLGATRRWDVAVERLTGAPLSVEPFARQFVN